MKKQINFKSKKIIFICIIVLLVLGTTFFVFKNTNKFNTENKNSQFQNNNKKQSDLKKIESSEQINEKKAAEKDNKKDAKKIESKEIENNKDQKTNFDSKSSSNNSNPVTNENSSSNNNNNTNSSTNNSNNNNNNNQKPSSPTIEQINNTTRLQLEAKYNIKIKYGEEMGNYKIRNKYLPVKLNDSNIIKTYLSTINTVISQYPAGLFSEIQTFGGNLTVYLVNSIPNAGVAAVTDHQFGDNVIMTIAVPSTSFTITLNHEMMHYLEVYIKAVKYPNGFSNWNSFNPINYGIFNASYDCTRTNTNAYYARSYGQTNDVEDRATIFENITRAYLSIPACYANGTPLRNKADYLVKEIRSTFSSVRNSPYVFWENLLK